MVNFPTGFPNGAHYDSHVRGSTDDLPLMAKAGEPLPDEIVDTLLKRQANPHGSARKWLAWRSYNVYRTCYEHHVLDGIRVQQNSKTIRRDMARFITKARNDARDVTEQIAVVWQNGADRYIVGDDDERDEEATNALQTLASQAHWDVKAQMINHLAWLQGPQFAVPMIRGRDRRRRLDVDIISPHIYDIVQDEDDPLGFPVGLAWHIHTRRNQQAQTVEDEVFVLDGQTLQRWRVTTTSADAATTELVSLTAHGFGRVPAALLRFTLPIAGDDWYLCEDQGRLVTGTIEIAVKMARMGLVRRAQNHKLLTVIGNLDKTAKGQEKGDPESALMLETQRGTGEVDANVFDYDVDPSNFIREVLFHVQCLIEPLGGHIKVDSGQPDWIGTIEIPHEVQVEHRNRQLKPATQFEVDFFEAATHIAKGELLEAAADLPPAEDIATSTRVAFAELSRELQDPEAAQTREDWLLQRGQTSQVQIMRRKLGNVSTDEAWAEIQRNLKEQTEFNDIARAVNLPLTPEGQTTTTPQLNGAMGTPAREQNRAAEAAEGDDNEAGVPAESEPT